MLDFQQGLAGNHLYSFNPVYQRNTSHDNTRIKDFDFWDSRQNRSYDNEIEFQAETSGEGFEPYSPRLWKTTRSFKDEAYPLLPNNHRCYNLSPRSRTQAIAKGRAELMEMIQNMPESSYELSLRDIVDQEILQDDKQETMRENNTWFDFKTEVQSKPKKKKKKKSNKPAQVARSGSMDSGTFLLKMFFPSCLLVDKKSTTGNCSKVSPKLSFEGAGGENHVQEWWKKRFCSAGEKKSSGRSSSGGSSSSENSNRSRHADSSFLPGCWPSFHTKNSKSKRWRGCLF